MATLPTYYITAPIDATMRGRLILWISNVLLVKMIQPIEADPSNKKGQQYIAQLNYEEPSTHDHRLILPYPIISHSLMHTLILPHSSVGGWVRGKGKSGGYTWSRPKL